MNAMLSKSRMFTGVIMISRLLKSALASTFFDLYNRHLSPLIHRSDSRIQP